jgi:hypothetical protein
MADHDPFESPKLLLARAKENAAEFRGRCQAFADSDPACIIEELDPRSGDKIVYLRLIKPLSPSVRPVISDAINNCRHALDQSVNIAAIEIRGGKANTYFPFGENAARFASIYDTSRYGPIPTQLRPYINGLKPYFGGDDVLCFLNRITGPNKHQIILTVEASPIGYIASGQLGGDSSLGIWPWDAAKKQCQIGRCRAGGTWEMNFKTVSFSISVGNGGPMQGQPAIGALDAFLSKAESIVLGLEVETARILKERGG